MSTPKRSSSASVWIGVVVGLVLMFAGMYVSKNVPLPFQEALAQQGIPLDLGKTVAVIGVFLILFPVINAFFIRPLDEAIHGRTEDLERTFGEAENLRAEMSKMRSEYEARIKESEARAREEIQQTLRETQDLRKQMMADANAKAEAMVKQAQEEIERERDRVLTDLRVHVTDLALSAAERIIGENMDTERNRKLVDEFLVGAEAGRA